METLFVHKQDITQEDVNRWIHWYDMASAQGKVNKILATSFQCPELLLAVRRHQWQVRQDQLHEDGRQDGRQRAFQMATAAGAGAKGGGRGRGAGPYGAALANSSADIRAATT